MKRDGEEGEHAVEVAEDHSPAVVFAESLLEDGGEALIALRGRARRSQELPVLGDPDDAPPIASIVSIFSTFALFQNVSLISSYPTRVYSRLPRFIDSTMAPWKGVTMDSTKSPGGSGRPAPAAARETPSADVGASTECAVSVSVKLNISGSSLQLAASVYKSSNSAI